MICDHIFMNVCFVFISTLIPDATLNSRSRDYGTVGRGGGGCVRMYVCECMCVCILTGTLLFIVCCMYAMRPTGAALRWGGRPPHWAAHGPSPGWAAPYAV